MKYSIPMCCWLIMLGCSAVFADEVRYYEANGVTYRETRSKVREPVTETKVQDQQRTVYRPETKVEPRKYLRTVQVPVTEYRRVSRWVNRYNPFSPPYLVEDVVPVVRWELRTEEVEVPVVQTQWVTETRTEQVPVVTRKFVEREVTDRVAISNSRLPAPGDSSPAVVRSTPVRPIVVGGVARLESDPPRVGAWRPATNRK